MEDAIEVSGRSGVLRRSVPLQVRISEFHMIYRVPKTGVLRLGWDNGLSLRKSKDIDVFVKRFDVGAANTMKGRRTRRRR